jgi:hypothetical protein
MSFEGKVLRVRFHFFCGECIELSTLPIGNGILVDIGLKSLQRTGQMRASGLMRRRRSTPNTSTSALDSLTVGDLTAPERRQRAIATASVLLGSLAAAVSQYIGTGPLRNLSVRWEGTNALALASQR